jgi:ABC-type nitrate/sulfonate/bicarbonate transport system substrate-binding protein
MGWRAMEDIDSLGHMSRHRFVSLHILLLEAARHSTFSSLSCRHSPSSIHLLLNPNNNAGWAISTGASRTTINNIADLKSSKIGISRYGSGSYVMGFVLADQQGWLSPNTPPFEFVPLNTFAALRDGVNSGEADFFMWEHFTSKKYYDSGEIKRVGEIYTPWSSWKIVASTSSVPADDARLQDLFQKVNQGIKYFLEHQDEAVKYISTELDYSEEDARSWLGTVRFAEDVKGVDPSVVEKTVGILQKAGVVGNTGLKPEEMVTIRRN